MRRPDSVTRGSFSSAALVYAITFWFAQLQAPILQAQPLVPPKGDASLSFSYIRYAGGDHLFSSDANDGQSTRGYVADGTHWFLGNTYGNTAVANLDYGLVDGLGLTVGVSYVDSKYVGYAPINPTIDDGQFHGTVQDMRVSARYVAMKRPLVVTPFAAFLFPTHSYESVGHSAPGRNLSELQGGVYLFHDLSPLISNAYLQAVLGYGISEKADGFQPKRGTFAMEAGYFLTDWLSISAQSDLLHTWDGRDWIVPGELGHGVTGNLELQGSGVDAARHFMLGGGFGALLSSRISVSGSFLTTLSGANQEDSNLFILGLGWDFSTPFAPRVNQ
jgi:hypothetical protein